MYRIITVAHSRYWQIAEVLPRGLRNAVQHRWEGSYRLMRVLLYALLVVEVTCIIFLTGSAKVLAFVFIVALLCSFVGSLKHRELLQRHAWTLVSLRSGRWSGYFIADYSPVYQAIMSPGLEEYLMSTDGQIAADAITELGVYEIEAADIVRDMNEALRVERSLFEQAVLESQYSWRLYNLAADIGYHLTNVLKDEALGFDEYFALQRQHIIEVEEERISRFIPEARAKIKELQNQLGKAYLRFT